MDDNTPDEKPTAEEHLAHVLTAIKALPEEEGGAVMGVAAWIISAAATLGEKNGRLAIILASMEVSVRGFPDAEEGPRVVVPEKKLVVLQ